MTNLRSSDDLQNIVSQGQACLSQTNSNLDILNNRWASLREHYEGVGAEDAEAQVALVNQKTELILEKLSELNRYSNEQSQQGKRAK